MYVLQGQGQIFLLCLWSISPGLVVVVAIINTKCKQIFCFESLLNLQEKENINNK